MVVGGRPQAPPDRVHPSFLARPRRSPGIHNVKLLPLRACVKGRVRDGDYVLPGLFRVVGHVRREQHIREGGEQVVHGRGILLLVDIEGGPGELPALEHVSEGVGIDELRSGCIDEKAVDFIISRRSREMIRSVWGPKDR